MLKFGKIRRKLKTVLHKRGVFICYTSNIVRKGSAMALS
nr:MAG TPA: hypothetical protein [Caudoviricetes sp.]